MTLTLSTCFVLVHDPDAALGFYRDALAALMAKGALNGVHFHTDDLDATFEKVRASGADIVQEPIEQPWGTRDCAVRDPSGNLVRIDQSPAAGS